MSFDSCFLELMSSTIKVRTWDSMSTDGYGTQVLSTSTATHRAHITDRQEMIRTFAGNEELATTTAWVATTSTFGPSDQIELPVSTGYAIRQLLWVERYDDEDGQHHQKLRFG